ncbi:MAG: c-type cytochrome [Rhodoferax sp.]|jgi:cytochrome c553|nr:c-type cytochrome [Rhodoferax sp.]
MNRFPSSGLAGAAFSLLLLLASNAWAQDATPLAVRLALCGGCHNQDGNSTIAENPNLAALDTAYLVRQMTDLKSGKRKNAIMNGIMGMVDAKEFDQLAKHFSEQKPKQAVKVAAKSVEAGKEIYDDGITAVAVPSCSGCHNEDGSGTDKFPRLAGQHAAYVTQQLLNFKSGERDNDDRGVMRAVAKRMSEAQMRSVAQYIATLQEGEK